MYTKEIEIIKQKIDTLLKTKKNIIIAIDGMTGSGKTTLATELKNLYKDLSIFHADHFFLPPDLKTKERLNQPGGNIHYEKMKEEIIDILQNAKNGDIISYKPFICKTQKYGDEIKQKYSEINIVEGSYCMHPYFGKYYDISIFLKINEKLQIERLTKRCPQMINNFIEKWIPLEKKYHDEYKIYDISEIKFCY